MNAERAGLLESVEELRREFDRSFALPVSLPEANQEAFLAIHAGGQPLALRVAELSRIEPRPHVVPLPTDNADLLGLAGVQSRLVPVYRLASLLGLPDSQAEWRWVAVCRLADALGLALESVDALLSVSQSSVVDLPESRPTLRHVKGAVRYGDEVRGIVHLQAIVASVHQRSRRSRKISGDAETLASSATVNSEPSSGVAASGTHKDS